MPWCKTCDDFHLFGSTRHLPAWEVSTYDTAGFPVWDEWRIYRAINAEWAAQRAAEEYDQEDYPLIRDSGLSIRVLVRLVGSQDVEAFRVHAEAVPTYYVEPDLEYEPVPSTPAPQEMDPND